MTQHNGVALTGEFVVPDGPPSDEELFRAADGLRERFGIGQITLQAEHSPPPQHASAMHDR